MKYIIMITIVIGLAAADFITGWMKAYIQHDISSQKMRIGGIHKLAEILIMCVACGLEIGLELLGRYYSTDTGSDAAQKLASVSGMAAALLFFVYILVMELTSILENYTEINPQAKWAKWIVKKLRILTLKEEENENGVQKIRTSSRNSGKRK